MFQEAPKVTVADVPSGERYEIGGEIGRGGMGEVKRARDQWLRRALAMKFLGDDGVDDDNSMRRFVEEAQITGQLDHPNIVPLYELGQNSHGELFFTMKRVRGETLGQLLHRLGSSRMTWHHLEGVVGILIKICDALEFAHSRGVIHRDIKPSNIMIGKYGQVYLLDWGLALVTHGERLTSDDGRVIGTPGYMAPEQGAIEPQPHDARSDVYGIGGLIYNTLTTLLPHPGKDAHSRLQHTRRARVTPPERARPGADLPPELCRIAMKALAREPDERYQDVAALRSDLQQFQRGGGWLRTRSIPAGAQIIREGDEADLAYIIVEGSCEAVKEAAGQRKLLRVMGPEEVFGETALLTGHHRTASVYALSDVVLKVVTRASLERELERSGWMRAIVHVLAERFEDADKQLSNIS